MKQAVWGWWQLTMCFLWGVFPASVSPLVAMLLRVALLVVSSSAGLLSEVEYTSEEAAVMDAGARFLFEGT